MADENNVKASIGSSFDDFLREEDIYEDVQAAAIKRVVAWQLAEEMKRQHITKVEMARRMHTTAASWTGFWIRPMTASSWPRWAVPLAPWAESFRSD